MKKLMVAIAGAVALTCSAFAEAQDWFNGGVAADFPTDASMSGGAWSNVTDQAAWDADAQAVVIEADKDTPVAFNATAAKTIGGDAKSVTISSTVKFTPFETLPEVPEGAKAGMIVFKVEDDLTFYALAKDGETNVWTDTEIEATAEDFYDVSVTIAEDGAATYSFGGSEFETTIATDGTISAANFAGDGEVSSLTAEYEANIVTFTVPEATGATITSVTVDGEVVTAPYAGKPGAELVVTYKADDGYLFGNKTDTFVYEGEVAAGEIPTGIADQGLKLAPAKIGTQLYYTLQEAFDAAKADETVALCTATDESVIYAGDKTFTLDMDGKAWTVTGDAIALKVDNADADITIKGNGSITVAKGFCVWTRQGEVTIENGTFTNDDNDNYAIYAGGGSAPNFLASKVTIKGGTFVNLNGEPYVWQTQLKNLNLNVQNNNPDAIIEVSGGTFTAEPKDDTGVNFVAEGCVAKKVGNVWTVGTAAAEVGGVLYLTLQEAFDAAKADETVKLLTAVAESVIYTGDKTFTLDMDGKAWTVTGDAIALKVDNADADITIKGNGSITVAKGFCVWTRQGEVTIENGTFTNDDNDNYAIYAGGGTAPNFLASKVTIKGGDFVNLNGEPYVWQTQLKNLNLNVQNNNPDAIIEVSGGTFTAEPKDDTGVNFVKAGYCAAKSGSKWVVTDSPAATIGTQFYLTLKDAVKDVKDNETIALCADLTVNDEISVAKAGVTIDLAYNTLTVGNKFQVSHDPAGCSLTIKKGTVTSTDRTFILRSYGAALTLEDVELDAENLQASDTGYTGALLVPSGNVTLKGETSIVNVDDGLNAIAFDNYAGAYTLGTLDFGSAEIEGNVLIAGGTVKNADKATFDDDTEFLIGAAKYSYCTEATFEGSGLVAMTGTLPTGTAPATPDYQITVTGKAYLKLNAAIAAVDENEKITCLDDVSVGGQYDKGFEIDANGKIVTVTGCIIDAGTVKLVNSKSKAPALTGSEGGFLINTLVTVKSGAELDMSEMPFGTVYGGVLDTSKAAVNLVDGSKATFYSWNDPSVDSPNWMYANMPAFFWNETIPVGAEITIGSKTWTATANGFEVPGTVAFAQIDAMGNIGGVQTPIVVNECYTSLDAAIKAVKVGGTVKLVKDVAEEIVYTGDKTFTLDQNGQAWAVTGDAIALKVDNADADITITNGNITVAKGFCVWTRQGEVTIENGTFTNDDNDNYAIYAGGGTAPNFLASKVTIKGGDFVNLNGEPYVWQSQLKNLNLNVQNNNPDAIIEVSGGTFTAEPKDDSGVSFLAEGYAAKKVGNVWTVGEAKVKIGTKLYLTLEDAAKASDDGDTITLLADVATTARVYFNQTNNVTVDLNGKTVSSGADECFVMGENGEPGNGTLTITGNGSVIQTYADEDADVVWARRGNVVISNGYFEVNGWCQCVYSTLGSKVKIYGGTFKNVTTKTESNYGDVLNVENTGAVTDIQCFGGSYSKDPALGDDALGGTFVAEGYASYEDGEMFSVAKLPAVTVTDITPAPENLDAAFAYATTDTTSAFTDGWKVDFYVSFNANIAENAVTLKGQYGTEQWTGAALPAMTAGVAVPLMQTAGNEVSVEQLLAIKTFNCGVLNVSAPADTEMTVVLKMYKKATGESFDLATKTYALVGKETPIVPGEPTIVETPEEAAKVTIALDDSQKAMTQEQQDEYTNLFTKVVTELPLGGYEVEFVATEAATNAITNAVAIAETNLLATVVAGETVDVSIETKPGLYYSVAVSETLSTAALEAAEGDRKMGTGEPLELEVETPAEAEKCFYQIMVHASDKAD